MVRHSMPRPEVASSRSLSACQSVYVGSGQSIAADPPVAAFHLLDHAPSDLAHVLALDRDHRVCQLADDLTLLFLAEHVFDDANLNERHWISPFVEVAVACRAEIGRPPSPLDTHDIVGNTYRHSKRQFERQ